MLGASDKEVSYDHIAGSRNRTVARSERRREIPGPASWCGLGGRRHFSPVYVNGTFTLDFGNWENFEPHHYCFHVSDAEFDAIFGRIQAAGIKYGSLPWAPDDMQVNTGNGGKDVYWQEPDGHIWEMLTVSYARPSGSAVSTTGT